MIPYSPISPAELAELELRYGRELSEREAEYVLRHRWEGEREHGLPSGKLEVMPSALGPGNKDEPSGQVETGAHRAVNECESSTGSEPRRAGCDFERTGSTLADLNKPADSLSSVNRSSKAATLSSAEMPTDPSRFERQALAVAPGISDRVSVDMRLPQQPVTAEEIAYAGINPRIYFYLAAAIVLEAWGMVHLVKLIEGWLR